MSESNTDHENTDEVTAQEQIIAPLVYREFNQQQLDTAYDQASLVKDRQPWERAWRKGSDEAVEQLNVQRDLAYGDSPAQKLDLFLPAGEGPFPLVAFFHGGGWTRNGKGQFAFPAQAFVEHDVAFAAIGFDMMPRVRVDEMVVQARQAVDWLLANAGELNLDADALFVAGHSSGAHLAVSTITVDNATPAPDIKGALLLSGVYDLEPLSLCSRNDELRFDEEAVRTLSPVRHIPQDPCPLVIACADGDLDEFQRQSETFAQAWEAGDGDAQFIRYARHNHFSLTLELADATSEAMQAFLALIEQPPV
jgi:arylformamidase